MVILNEISDYFMDVGGYRRCCWICVHLYRGKMGYKGPFCAGRNRHIFKPLSFCYEFRLVSVMDLKGRDDWVYIW